VTRVDADVVVGISAPAASSLTRRKPR